MAAAVSTEAVGLAARLAEAVSSAVGLEVVGLGARLAARVAEARLAARQAVGLGLGLEAVGLEAVGLGLGLEAVGLEAVGLGFRRSLGLSSELTQRRPEGSPPYSRRRPASQKVKASQGK